MLNYFKKHSKRERLKGAALIKERELKVFLKFLQKNFKDIKINVKTIDQTSISFYDLDEFLQYPNFTKRKIMELEISCEDDNRSLDVNY